MDELILDDHRTMLPSLVMSIHCDIMDCKVAWCRFATARLESLERPRHRHMVYELHYLLNGRLDYSFPAFQEYSVKKGRFMLIPRGALHATVSPDEETEYLVIAFVISSKNEAVNVVFSDDCKPYIGEFTPAMESLVLALKQKTKEQNLSDSLSAKLIIHSILLETVDSIVASMDLHYTPKRLTTGNDPRVNRIVRFVTENRYRPKLSCEDVAAELHITTRQLNRICNAAFGCSIHSYIIAGRIEAMKELLKDSCYTTRDIAHIFGFTDVYAFIKHFTKFAGMSPGKYRKAARLAQ